jgi:hypothetical protein
MLDILTLNDLDRYMSLLDRMGSHPSIGKPDGATRNMPHVYFVDSGSGAAGNSGARPDEALSTLDAAVGKCTANRGDVIIVLPGHAETIVAAGGVALDVAGISVIGLGRGTLKPTFTFGTATTADINVSAANILFKNFRLVSDINDLGMFLDVDEGNFTVEDCDFVTSSAKEALNFINLATTKDDFVIRNCRFFQPTDPAGSDGGDNTGGIYVVDSENILVEDCEYYGNFETAFFHNKTTAAKNVWIVNCRGINVLSGSETVQLVDGCNGAIVGGGFITPAEAAQVVATLVGTMGNSFFVLAPGTFGNDGAQAEGGWFITAAS